MESGKGGNGGSVEATEAFPSGETCTHSRTHARTHARLFQGRGKPFLALEVHRWRSTATVNGVGDGGGEVSK